MRLTTSYNESAAGFDPPGALNATTAAVSSNASGGGPGAIIHMRLVLTFAHLLLVALGSVNLLVILGESWRVGIVSSEPPFTPTTQFQSSSFAPLCAQSPMCTC